MSVAANQCVRDRMRGLSVNDWTYVVKSKGSITTASLLSSFSIRTHVGQTPNCGLLLISSKHSIGQYLHLLEECQTEVPFVFL